MRVARVIGKVTMSLQTSGLKPGSYLVVRTCNRGTLAGKNDGNNETLVLYDCLGAREGDMVGLVEGREACAPFYPEKVPYDSYNACILDSINFHPVLPVEK